MAHPVSRMMQVNVEGFGTKRPEYFLWSVDPGDVNQQELIEYSFDFKVIVAAMDRYARTVGIIDN